MEHELSKADADLLVDMCDRIGVGKVLRALAHLCAYESRAPGAPAKWDEAYRAALNAAQLVADLEG